MKTHPSRRRVLALLSAGVAPFAGAQVGLKQSIRLIVPAPAAGTTDFVARGLSEALRRTAGIEAKVDNRPGVGGAVATEALLSAPEDGATLLLSPNSIVTEVPYTVKPRYDPFKDLVPLAEVASIGIVLVADAELSVRTVQEMVAYAKARPGRVAYASFGAGTISHVKGLQFCRAAGIEMLHVGYKGSPPALIDVVGGRVPFMFDGITTSAPYVKAQKLRALAVTSPQRSPLLPDVPTFAEVGYPDLTQTIAMTLFGTPGIPAGIVAQLRGHVLDALASPELAAAFGAAGLQVAPRQQAVDDLRRAMRREYERTGEILRMIRYSPAT